MKNFKAVVHILQELNYVLNIKQKKQMILVTIIIIIRTCFELLGVTILVPFLELMLTPEKLMKKRYVILIMKLE